MSISSSKFAAFAVVFSLCLLADVALNRLFSESEDIELENSRSFFCSKVRADRYQVIAYGDSRTYMGVKTPTLKEMLGLSCFNCGFSGGGINAEMLEYVDSKLDRSAGGSVVVLLGLTPQALSERARPNRHYREHLEAYRALGDRVFGEEGERRGLFSPYPLRRRLDMIVNGRMKDDKVCQDGWMGAPSPASEQAMRERHEHTRESYEARFASTGPSERSQEELKDGIAKWTKEGVVVICYRVPTCGWMVALEDERSGCDMNRIRKDVERCGAIWIDLDQTKYETHDGSHLSGAGAELMTIDLAAAVRDVLEKRKAAPAGEAAEEK